MKKYALILAVLLIILCLGGCRTTDKTTDAETKSALVSQTVPPQTEQADGTTEEPTEKEAEMNTKKPTETVLETAGQEVTEEKKTENPKITVEQLFDANTLSMLLYNYSCVRVVRTSDYSTQIEQYSLIDNEIMQIIQNTPKGSDESYYYGQYGAFYFEVESDRTKAYVMFDDLNTTVSFPFENMFADLFSECKADFVKEKEDCYIYKLTYPNKSFYGYEVLVAVKKDTLAIVKAVYKSDGEISQTAILTLGAEVKDYAKMISKWEAERKTVTVFSEKNNGNNKTSKQTQLSLPADWEVVVRDIDELNYYMDKNYTKPYQYPGNGKSYKLYVTNSMG